MTEVRKQLDRWLAQETLAEDLRAELAKLAAAADRGADPGGEAAQKEIYERFYKDLEFGTGGLRGILGAGGNRMNIYTVGRTSQGIADFISAHYEAPCGCKRPAVAISYDSRNNSRLFAQTAASVFLANGINAYLFDELAPTPALSFAVRYHRCAMGVMITASHNPAEYNGYKVYNSAGCQVSGEEADEILANIERTDLFDGVRSMPFAEAEKSSGFQYLGRETKEAFLRAVLSERLLDGEEGNRLLADLSVVYTPLNGSGNKPVREMLARIGVGRVEIVKEQELPDGNFPTCPYPNPEKKEALALGLALCEKAQPDLLLATDPDCDRVGIAVRHHGEYRLLTGNQVGVLLLAFICERRAAAGALPKDPLAVRTIVTTRMVDRIAEDYGVEVRTTLTGFKYIGELIGGLAASGQEKRYIFGFEESYGYLSGSYVRDKDAVNGSMLICEMIAYHKAAGKTAVDVLEALYERYGWFRDDLMDFAFAGAAGMETMERIMAGLREKPPLEAAGRRVVQRTDYQRQERYFLGKSSCCDLAAGTRPTGLPASNVLEYILEDGTSFTVRPSGTEPKLKIYFSAKGGSEQEAAKLVETLKEEMTRLVERVK